jgi:hypothetical protein
MPSLTPGDARCSQPVALRRGLRLGYLCPAHGVVHRVPVTGDLSERTSRGQGGFLKSRVYSLDLGQALLDLAPFFPELAQLLGDYRVVIHRLE